MIPFGTYNQHHTPLDHPLTNVIGMGLTVWALVAATKSMRQGDHHKTNRMFRARIAAQGFTLVAMVAGSMYWKSDRQKRKEFDVVVKERKAKEKNELWIKELEARDQEEKQIRAEKERRMRRMAGREDQIKSVEAKNPVLEEKGAEAGATPEDGVPSAFQPEKKAEHASTLASVKELISGKK